MEEITGTRKARLDPAEPLAELAALIPAWRPECRLFDLANDLSGRGFGRILIVDDGSGEAYHAIFAETAAIPRVELLRHAVNRGKGRALKTGFNHLLNACPELSGVVTADADGQHTPEDIERVARALLAPGAGPVLGARGFDHRVPFRSRFGNRLTQLVFGFLTGVWLRDTQTGLRGLHRELLVELLPIEGDRYEYEMTMLAYLCRTGTRPTEVPISTVYIENNRGSHFNPLWDSMRIYFALLRIYATSFFAAGIDFAGFSLCFALSHRLLLSISVGRLSSLLNDAVHRGFVFQRRRSASGSPWRCYLLVIGLAAAGYGLILGMHVYLHLNVFAAKICAEVLLSLFSFSARRTLVFRCGGSL